MESREKHGVLSHTPTPERKKQLVDFHEQFKEFKFIEICLYYFLVTVIFVIFQFVFNILPALLTIDHRVSSDPQIRNLGSVCINRFPLVQSGLAYPEHLSRKLPVQAATTEGVQVALSGCQSVFSQRGWSPITLISF